MPQSPARVVTCPGRVNLIGDHTDDNGGLGSSPPCWHWSDRTAADGSTSARPCPWERACPPAPPSPWRAPPAHRRARHVATECARVTDTGDALRAPPVGDSRGGLRSGG
ncbi:MAG: hypothetical protein M0Z93_07165 [Actinomycetota bacterium]|nr:hypothetical protein [Actinomycetota bacterium]